MKTAGWLTAIVIIGFCFAASGFCQDPIVYPKNGQSQKQMEKDKYACYSWAKGQTGFDPTQAPRVTAPPPQQYTPQGGAVRGAARGALVGVAPVFQ